jgi:hypothetical protein
MEAIPALSESEVEVLKLFAVAFGKTGKTPVYTKNKLMKYAMKKNLPESIDDILKSLVEKGILAEKAKGAYYLTAYGWRVSGAVWGPGLEKLRPVG